MKSTWKIIHNEKGTTQHDTSVPSLVMHEKIITHQKKLLIFLIIVFYQWQTPLMLTTIKLKIPA